MDAQCTFFAQAMARGNARAGFAAARLSRIASPLAASAALALSLDLATGCRA